MHTTLQMLLIICPLVFLAGFVDSIAGGGGLLSLPAYLLAGLPMHQALATNKLSATFGSVTAAYRFIKSKNVIWKAAGISVVMALIGSFIGARLVLLVDEKYLKYLLIILLPIISVFVLTRKNFGYEDKTDNFSDNKIVLLSGLFAFLLGTYDGFFGPGTGTFLILVFTGILGFDMTKASGNAKVVNCASNVASLAAFIISGKIVLVIGILAGLFNLLGSWIGSGLAIKNGAKIIRPIFICVLALLFGKIIWDMLTAA